MRELVLGYKWVEKFMSSGASKEAKLKFLETNEISESDVNEIEKKAYEEINELCDAETRNKLIVSCEPVRSAYEFYLWNKEEADYMYPHAKGAIAVFKRDNSEEMSK